MLTLRACLKALHVQRHAGSPHHRSHMPFPASFSSPAAPPRSQKHCRCTGSISSSPFPTLPTIQALIVAPSRELCIQIQRTAQQLLPPDSRKMVAQAIGGANPKRQAEALGGHGGVWPLLVVGTPGRVAELVQQGELQVWSTPVLVLDEVRCVCVGGGCIRVWREFKVLVGALWRGCACSRRGVS